MVGPVNQTHHPFHEKLLKRTSGEETDLPAASSPTTPYDVANLPAETSDNDMEDDSDDYGEENHIDPYEKKYQLLVERCEVIQQDNERLVNRMHSVLAMLRSGRAARRFLMAKLDKYGDDWQTASLPIQLNDVNHTPEDTKPKPTTSRRRAPRPKPAVRKPRAKNNSTGKASIAKQAQEIARMAQIALQQQLLQPS